MFDPMLTTSRILKKLGGDHNPGKVLAKVNLEPDDLTGAYNFINGKIGLAVGNTYTVTTDSGKFSCVCQEYDGDIYIGNHDVLDGVSNSGERFCICEYSETEGGETVWFTDFCDLDGGKMIAVSTTETIVPIDPKYLPDMGGGSSGGESASGGLPTIELETEIVTVQNGSTALSKTDSIAVEIALASQSPVIVGFVYNGIPRKAVFDWQEDSFTHLFVDIDSNNTQVLVLDTSQFFATVVLE